MPPAADARALYGRRKGHRLRPRQEALFESLLPRLRLDLAAPPPADTEALFPPGTGSVRMEIGFGGAEHLIHCATGAPATGFIGCEPFVNGVAKALSLIEARGLANIRLYDGDAGEVLDWLPERALESVHLLYPDPWPKKRHNKRRFVSPENLGRLARAIRPGGHLFFATDIPDYADWTLRRVGVHAAFEWTAERAGDWRAPWPGWPGTRYEAKAIKAGRVPAYFTFRRL